MRHPEEEPKVAHVERAIGALVVHKEVPVAIDLRVAVPLILFIVLMHG